MKESVTQAAEETIPRYCKRAKEKFMKRKEENQAKPWDLCNNEQRYN